ncbi:hypothetical protein [Azohydromonas lata]|uniref:hypothetical protein n=1 Tax=Azohydromonas lata TaxID=45677 RepID=UPI00082967EF|nr:hypothetical protein [Azohydromonas lata]
MNALTRRRFAHSCLGFLTAAAAAALPGVALAAPVNEADFEAAWSLFDRAAAGDGSRTDEAASRFERMAQADPSDLVLQAYAGAALTLRGRDAWLPWRKMAHTEDGLARLDKALAQLQPAHDKPLHRGTPASMEVRFVAASVFLGMPGFFNRGPRGEQLLAEVVSSPLLAASPVPFQGVVLMRAGQQALKAGKPAEARRHFEAVLARNAPQAAAARAALQGMAGL